MDMLRAMRSFITIADAGSLTAAARLQGSSLPTVVRLLAALEAELGIVLFNRTTRRIALTDAGRRYLERCREVQAMVEEAAAELHAEQTEPQGRLVVTAPVFFGERHVAGGISAYVQRYPKVSVDVQLFDRVVNLVEEGIDVGIRIGMLPDSSLIARQVGSMRRLTVAAPSYLGRSSALEQPKDLLNHNCVRVWREGATAWAFEANGKAISVAVRGNLSFNQVAAAAGACVAGLGVGTFFAYQVAPYVASGALQVVLSSFETPPRPIHIVYPEARWLPVRTRVFIDFMREHILAEQRAWEPSPPKRRAGGGAVRAKGRRVRS